MIDSGKLHSLFPFQKVGDAKALLIAVNPWWKRYLDRFEIVPISVPTFEEEDRWRARVEVPDRTLTMYVDLDFAMKASLSEVAGEIEKALQFSRRRFSERSEKVPEAARGEYLRIGQHMEVGSALTRKYDDSALRNPDFLYKLLSTSVVFGLDLIDRYDVHELPVTDTSWMPEMFDLPEGLPAEEYAMEMARRDGLFDDPEQGDGQGGDGEQGDSGDGLSEGQEDDSQDSSDSSQEQGTEADDPEDADHQTDEDGSADATDDGDGSGVGDESADGEREAGNGAGDSEDSPEKGEENRDGEGSGGSGEDKGAGEGDGDNGDAEDQDGKGSREGSEGQDGQSGQGDGGTGDTEGQQSEQGKPDKPQGGEMSPDSVEDNAAGEHADADSGESGGGEGLDEDNAGADYGQLNTDNGEGQGRMGGWQGAESQTGQQSASTNDVMTNEDGSAQSTGIEESNQVASSDAMTDRMSSGTTGDISQSERTSTIAEQIRQMRQEYPVLDWDAEESRPEVYDPDYIDDASVDEFEEAERTLEAAEREEADSELSEDVQVASKAVGFDPAAPLMPSDEDVVVAEEELHRTGEHWTDILTDKATGAVSSVVLRGTDDFSYAVRNPNQSLTGPILMGSITYAPTIYALFDTSFSMLALLGKVKSYLNELFEHISGSFGAEVRWFAASDDVYATGEAREFDADVFTAFAKGRRGTNFGSSLAEIIDGTFEFDGEVFEAPDVILVFSDMEVPWPQELGDEPSNVEFISVIPVENTVPMAVKVAVEMQGNPEWVYDGSRVVPMY